jgi:hypothetical protein
MVHTPVQQLAADVQASPCCRQKDDALHRPLKQSPEQQSALEAQVLLRVLHIVLSGVHIPPVHVPLQHAAFDVHALRSEVQAGRLQTPPVHVPVQQSLGCVQAPPTWRQAVPLELVLVLPELVLMWELVVPPPAPLPPLAEAPVPCVEVLLLPQPTPTTVPRAHAITAEKKSRKGNRIIRTFLSRSARVRGERPRGYMTGMWQVHPVSPVMHGMPFASVHGIMLQHGDDVEHCWP